MESEQLFHRGYYRNSYNSITSASSDEELLDGAGVIMDFQTSEDDNLLDGDTAVGKFGITTLSIYSHECLLINIYIVLLRSSFGVIFLFHCGISCTINLTILRVYSSVAFSTFTVLCNYHLCLVFITPKESLVYGYTLKS